MNLSIEIKPDFNGTISIIDYTQEIEGEYIPEDVETPLLKYYNFKYSQTCTLDVIKAITTKEEKLINVLFTDHDSPTDSVRVPLPHDGFYSVDHLVLPTLDWLEAVKDEDLSTYKAIYVTDGINIYKYFEEQLIPVLVDEILEINPEETTLSIARYKVFSIDKLKRCYASVARSIMNSAPKCGNIDETLKFNRDFLWMTINVINIYLERDLYSEAQITLENLGCYNFCPDILKSTTNKNNSCGCSL